MRVLELFKGTGSVGNHLQKLFKCEIISLDINKKSNPTHLCDIMDFEYKQYEEGYFTIIWASPECKIYSQAQSFHIGENRKWKNKEELNKKRQEDAKYVNRVIEIIEYLKPQYWFIENPYYSAMKDLDCMKKLKSVRMDYCRFGREYQKPTRIWTNQEYDNMICNCKIKPHKYRLCVCGGKHKDQIKDKTNTAMRYAIPSPLLDLLFSKVNNNDR